MAYVTIRIKGEEGHTQKDLTGDRVVLGRAEDAGIVIKHESISRQHCEFVLDGETWYINDLESANGTRLNNEKLEGRLALTERDVVKAGKARLTFHVGERKKRKRKSRDHDGIALDDGDLGGDNAPTREAGVDDPPEAVTCEHCECWLSVAHHLPGDSMSCPQCKRTFTVPQLVS